MPIVDCLLNMPTPYIVIMLIFSIYYIIRDILEQSVNLRIVESINPLYKLKKYEKIIIHYIQGIIFKFVTTVSSFIALWIGYKILLSLESFDNIGAGTAILLIFLFAWGIIGVVGYLTMYISMAKFKIPGMKDG